MLVLSCKSLLCFKMSEPFAMLQDSISQQYRPSLHHFNLKSYSSLKMGNSIKRICILSQHCFQGRQNSISTQSSGVQQNFQDCYSSLYPLIPTVQPFISIFFSWKSQLTRMYHITYIVYIDVFKQKSIINNLMIMAMNKIV